MSAEYLSIWDLTSKDIKSLICLRVPDEDMKNLVLTNKEISEICSEEIFYRMRIIIFFGADLSGYCKPSSTGVSKSYQNAYRGLAHLFCAEHHHKWAEDVDTPIPWCTFVFACANGYIPIILNKKVEILQLLNSPRGSELNEYFCEFTHTLGQNYQWSVLDILIKEYGIVPDYADIAFYLTLYGSIDEFKKWIAKGLDLKNVDEWPVKLCTSLGKSEMAIFLIDNGAPLIYNSTATWDMQPLVHAVKNCSVKVVKMIIEKGADIHYNHDMIFKRKWWRGFKHTRQIREMLDYLSSLGKFTSD